MKLIKNEEYQNIITILKLIHNNHPDAIVAGGAVRDLFLEQPVKDIDIFVQDSDTYIGMNQAKYWWNLLEMSRPEQHSWDCSLDTLNPVHNSDSSPDEDNDIIHSTGIDNVFEGNKDDIEVNIVVTTVDPITYVNDYFDIGLCKAYFDGQRFRFTSDFIEDRDNNTLTIVSKHMTQQRILKVINNHVPRLHKKYPHHQIKVAECNQHLLIDD